MALEPQRRKGFGVTRVPVETVDLTSFDEIKFYGLEKFRKGKIRKSTEAPTYNCATLISLDPGGTTGWTMICLEPWALSDPTEKVLSNIMMHHHGQLASHDTQAGYNEVADTLMTLIQTWPDSAIVIEDFVIRNNNRTREFLSPVRITEKLDYALWKHNRSWFRQQPSEAKTTATDDRLKRWKMWQSEGNMVHARDADRHAITFLRKAKGNKELRALAWPHLYSDTGLYT